MSIPTRKLNFNSNNHSNSAFNQNKPTAKRSVPGPTTPFNFLVMAIYKYAKKPLMLDINYRVGVYLSVVTVGSVYFDLFRMPRSYFSNKYNFLNQFFAKWAWGWTLCVLFCFITSTSYIINGGNVSRIRRNVMRLLVGTSCWYFCTGLFHMIENETGECHIKINGKYTLEPSIKGRHVCKRREGLWIGFDISGHVFLLVLCNMWLCEEAQMLRCWRRLERHLLCSQPGAPSPAQSRLLSAEESATSVRTLRSLGANVKLLTVLLAFFSLLWDLLLVATVVYFHNMPSKLTALVIALACWFLAYRCLFPLRWAPLPLRPPPISLRSLQEHAPDPNHSRSHLCNCPPLFLPVLPDSHYFATRECFISHLFTHELLHVLSSLKPTKSGRMIL